MLGCRTYRQFIAKLIKFLLTCRNCCLLSAPPVPDKMKPQPFFHLLAATLMAILGVTQTMRAEDSLYDPSRAEKLGPNAAVDFGPRSSEFRYDKRMIRAAELAAQRARDHSSAYCWHYVKDALVDAQVVESRPTTVYAKEAGDELTSKFGFSKLAIENPFDAPVGSVLVYGGKGAGHVELRTTFGFVSDFWSVTPSHRPLLGIYVKKSGES